MYPLTLSLKAIVRLLLVWTMLFQLGSTAVGVQTYELREIEAIGETWRWRDIEGLADGSIHCFDVTGNGVVWIGIGPNVFRYDGTASREFKGFRGSVRAVKETADGELYVLTRFGLSRLNDGSWDSINNTRNNQARRILEDSQRRVWYASRTGIVSVMGDEVIESSLDSKLILDIEFDASGQLWVLDSNGSVFCCATEAGSALITQKWEGSGPHPESRHGIVGMIEAASDGKIWVVDSNPRRLPRFLNRQTGKWSEVDLRLSGGTNRNYSVLEPEDGRLLISGDESIAYQSDAGWRVVSNAALNLTDQQTFMSTGEDGALWFLQGISGRGRCRLARIDYAAKRWKRYDGLNYQCDFGDGSTCFLTKRGELAIHYVGRNEWKRYTVADGLIDNALVVICGSAGDIWVAGSHENEAAVNHFDGENWILHRLPELGSVISRFSSRALSDGSLVFGSGQETGLVKGEGGIVRFQFEEGRYKKERLEGAHQRVISIQEDAKGDLLYSKNQIFRYNGGNPLPVKVPRNHKVSWVDDFIPLENGALWYCNWGQGVHFYDGKRWRVFDEKDGLSSSFVSNLLVLEDGSVFALTAKGLDRYQDGQWQTLQGPEFSGIREGSTLRYSSDGSIWVSLASRSWYFRKEARLHNGTNFSCLRFKADENAPETEVFFVTEPPKYSNTAYVSWAGKDTWSETPQKELRFAYKIDENDWSPFSSQTSTYLSELSPGDHTFRVKAQDQDGNIDTTPATLSFVIYAPFWESPWFVITAVAIPVIVIGLVILLLLQRIKHMAEIDGVRTRFLTNISHELRSPLALIMLPLEKFIQEKGIGENSKGLATALRSARRLNQLVEQLLDLQKVKALKYKLRPKVGDIVRYTRAIVTDFDNLASSRDQRVQFVANCETYVTRFDEDIYRKLLDNLVLNAIKHSPARSMISVVLETGTEDDNLRLIVEDNGSGILPTVLERIFEPFYNNSEDSSQRIRSFGIGLALVKELVEFCHATITAESPVKSEGGRKYGSRFTIEFQNMPLAAEPLIAREVEDELAVGINIGKPTSSPDSSKRETDKAVVLLVDDHNELREYIAEELASDFHVIEAEGSREGVALAAEKMPDVIIADVVMPEMNGIAFCQALKNNPSTSHIPIILQTSLASEENEGEGLEAGAIDYITKPTSIFLIKKRINSLLDGRNRYAKHLRTQLLQPANGNSFNRSDLDAVFVKKIRSILEAKWNDAEFNTETLASELGMSRSAFYLKFKAIANVPPAEAIKNFRLGKAKELLSCGRSVSEVATLVGYSETSPFNRAFKKSFSCTPSEFQKRAKSYA